MLLGSNTGKTLASALPVAFQGSLLGGREVGSRKNVSYRAAGNILKRAQHAERLCLVLVNAWYGYERHLCCR